MKRNHNTQNRNNDCWNKTGIHGDKSCPELKKVIHCHNCQVFSEAGRFLLEKQLSDDYLNEWTEHLSQEKKLEPAGTLSVVVFRIGTERLTLPTQLIKEITESKVIHTIPHRTNKILLGLVNIHGGIKLCFSLGNLLGLEEDSLGDNLGGKAYRRMIVVEWEGESWVFPVAEILGVQRFKPEKLNNAPETVSKAHNTYTKGIITWQDINLGYLDHELVFSSLKRSIL